MLRRFSDPCPAVESCPRNPAIHVASATAKARLVNPLLATLTTYLQTIEYKATLSLSDNVLTGPVKHKSFICNAYKKRGGVGVDSTFLSPLSSLATFATRRNACNSSPLIRLLHNMRTPGVGGYASSAFKLLPSALSFQLSAVSTSRRTRIAHHWSRVTDHGPQVTEHGSLPHEPAHF
jgi:hypothetical protein